VAAGLDQFAQMRAHARIPEMGDVIDNAVQGFVMRVG
jgi:hypothetical protein